MSTHAERGRRHRQHHRELSTPPGSPIDGTIKWRGSGSSLLLLNDTLNDWVGSTCGRDPRSMAGTTLELSDHDGRRHTSQPQCRRHAEGRRWHRQHDPRLSTRPSSPTTAHRGAGDAHQAHPRSRHLTNTSGTVQATPRCWWRVRRVLDADHCPPSMTAPSTHSGLTRGDRRQQTPPQRGDHQQQRRHVESTGSSTTPDHRSHRELRQRRQVARDRRHAT